MIGLCAVVVALVPGPVSAVPGAHTYYVSPSGDDTANGWSKRTSWRTLSRVAQQWFIAGGRLMLEGGAVVHPGSIVLDPSNSAGDFEIGSYGGGRAIIDAGNHSGIVIRNLSDIKISSLVIRGDGGTTDNDDLLAGKNGLIYSPVDGQPTEIVRHSNFSIDRVEVSNFEGNGVSIYSFSGTALSHMR